MASNTANDVQNTETTPPAANKVNSDDMATTAANKVLNTVELLELILLDVDFTTLLTSQATNKTFNSTIADSPKIQEKFFHKPPTVPRNEPTPHPNSLTIETPERFHLSIEQLPSGLVSFYFKYVVPRPTSVRATGSWRRLYVRVPIEPGRSRFFLRDFQRGTCCTFLPEKSVWTLGEALDALVGEEVVGM